ncbi:MAG TPA: hypothetical protein VK506_02770, partial [Conexibacter sp.]|nr:hypothetical protein [Conexibacter sp.]
FTHKPSIFHVLIPQDEVSDPPGFNALRNVVQETITVKRPAGILWGNKKPEAPGLDAAGIGADLVRALFQFLADTWIDQTQYDSSLDTVFSHPAVELIESLGRSAFPLALERLADQPEQWSYILSRLTGAHPLPANAQREDAQRIWSGWAADNGWPTA